MKKTIAFYQPHLDIQGTGVSNYDYAHFNQVILGNKSYMICDKDCKHTHPLAVKKFKKSMEVKIGKAYGLNSRSLLIWFGVFGLKKKKNKKIVVNTLK